MVSSPTFAKSCGTSLVHLENVSAAAGPAREQGQGFLLLLFSSHLYFGHRLRLQGWKDLPGHCPPSLSDDTAEWRGFGSCPHGQQGCGDCSGEICELFGGSSHSLFCCVTDLLSVTESQDP